MEATIADLVHQQRQPPNTRGYLDASEDLDDYRQFPGGRSTQQAGSHADDAVTLDKGSPSSHVSPVDGMALIVDPQRQDLLFFGNLDLAPNERLGHTPDAATRAFVKYSLSPPYDQGDGGNPKSHTLLS